MINMDEELQPEFKSAFGFSSTALLLTLRRSSDLDNLLNHQNNEVIMKNTEIARVFNNIHVLEK